MNIVGLSISQWLPCPLAIWAFGLDGKSCLVKSCYIQTINRKVNSGLTPTFSLYSCAVASLFSALQSSKRRLVVRLSSVNFQECSVVHSFLCSVRCFRIVSLASRKPPELSGIVRGVIYWGSIQDLEHVEELHGKLGFYSWVVRSLGVEKVFCRFL